MSAPLKIRASRAGVLLTNARSGKGLSETVKTMLIELWIENNYHRITEISNKFIEKGLAVEEDAITLLCDVTGDFYKKNIKRFENDYITGTPDIITKSGTVIDIKSSWNLITYVKAGLTPIYEYQLRCYMELTGCSEAILAYCLVDTPEPLIISKAKRISWQVDETIMPMEDIVAGLRQQMTFSDIPKHERLKTFRIEADKAKMDDLYQRIERAREFYQTITLAGTEALTEA